ncbi:MAG: hypothetical protein HY892_18710 [Deltaproteobacteria bacterium]|nr:hypothetical protein [Deltaproteobacteria bacterium]
MKPVLIKILRVVKVLAQGAAIGLWLNYSWHYFLAVTLGWGDRAPDWYFHLQGPFFLVIFVSGLIGWAVVSPRLDGFLNGKKPESRLSPLEK